MIETRIDGRIALLSLVRPKARNAVPAEGWDAIAAAVAAVPAGVRAIILRSGAPGVFSAGADLGDFAALAADPARPPLFRVAMRRATDALASAPVPVVAAIDGGCFGAGVALALACDLRVAGPDAVFGVPPARLGISYPQGDIDRLRRQVGPGQAARLLLTGDAIDADEAHRIGLVEYRAAVDADATARAIAERLCGNAPTSLVALRAALAGHGDGNAAFDRLFAGPDLAEGLAARAASRPAAF